MHGTPRPGPTALAQPPHSQTGRPTATLPRRGGTQDSVGCDSVSKHTTLTEKGEREIRSFNKEGIYSNNTAHTITSGQGAAPESDKLIRR